MALLHIPFDNIDERDLKRLIEGRALELHAGEKGGMKNWNA